MSSVWLGEGADGRVSFSKEARDVHTHVIGLSRQGKSYFLEHLIRQDITNGAGVCVIDPHGEMYDNLVAWLAANDMHKRRRIHLINPAKGDWSVGFNPLCVDDDLAAARVAAMIEGCQKVWEDTESTGHKTLANLLEMIFLTLAHHRLSLHEAGILASLQYKEERQRLVAETGDPYLMDEWAQMDQLRPSEFVQQFQAVRNRLRAMVRSPGISQMVGQTEDVINFKTCMDNDHVVLVNLAHKGRIPPAVSQTVGALITADLFHAAQCREVDYAKQHPFYCYIDECGDYLNETIVKGLDQTAKFGLHYILSHQGLDQLGQRRDDPIRRGVMRGAQNKVVFLQDDIDTTMEIGELLFGKSYDLERPKQVLIKPGVVGFQREWLHAEGYSSSVGTATVSGTSTGLSAGLSALDIPEATMTVFEGNNEASSSAESSSSSYSESRSRSEALVPILQDLPNGVYSLDDMRHMSSVEIRLLQKRQAFAYAADDRQPQQFVTADVFPVVPTIEQVTDFYQTIGGREPSAKPVEEVKREVVRRRETLLASAAPAVLETEDFWEP